jgi:predicted nucleic acid binding AN1-type Zn finger protein
MDQESNQMEQHPVLCRNGCGFYSNNGTDGLCSVCYKDMVKKKQQPPTNMQATLAPTPGAMASLSIDESSSASSPAKTSVDTALPTVILPSQTDKRTESEIAAMGGSAVSASHLLRDETAINIASPSNPEDNDGNKEGGKKKKNRCLSCKKKVGLTGFTCRCGGLFCSIHRYSDKHECTFDYKELGAEEIRKSNPVVVACKVQKI